MPILFSKYAPACDLCELADVFWQHLMVMVGHLAEVVFNSWSGLCRFCSVNMPLACELCVLSDYQTLLHDPWPKELI